VLYTLRQSEGLILGACVYVCVCVCVCVCMCVCVVSITADTTQLEDFQDKVICKRKHSSRRQTWFRGASCWPPCHDLVGWLCLSVECRV